MINIKRIYETPRRDDGTRILVDRLWPSGLTKEKAEVDLWLKDIAPGTELRKWFGHDPEKWSDFRKKYRSELRGKDKKEQIQAIRASAKKGPVTLLYGTRDTQHNEAVILREYFKD